MNVAVTGPGLAATAADNTAELVVGGGTVVVTVVATVVVTVVGGAVVADGVVGPVGPDGPDGPLGPFDGAVEVVAVGVGTVAVGVVDEVAVGAGEVLVVVDELAVGAAELLGVDDDEDVVAAAAAVGADAVLFVASAFAAPKPARPTASVVAPANQSRRRSPLPTFEAPLPKQLPLNSAAT